MKKQEAIQWCVENVNTWPSNTKGIVSTPDGWRWIKSTDDDTGYVDMILINGSFNEFINKCDWIDALMKPHSDSESVFG